MPQRATDRRERLFRLPFARLGALNSRNSADAAIGLIYRAMTESWKHSKGIKMESIEYRVRPVTRYVVTRYENKGEGQSASVRGLGEYDNQEIAHEVGYALCRAEHERLGWPPGDMRIKYPLPVCGAELSIIPEGAKEQR